jgi:hypothetical protein
MSTATNACIGAPPLSSPVRSRPSFPCLWSLGSHELPPLLGSIDDEHPTGVGPHPQLGPPEPLIPRHVGLVGPDLGRLIGSRRPSGGTPLAGWRLAEPLPQERLAAVGQLPVRALDLAEELGQGLVAGVPGVLEVGRARVRTLQGVIEDADDVVVLIPRAGRAVARRHTLSFQKHESIMGSPAPRPRGDHSSAAGHRPSPWVACPPVGPAWTGCPRPPHQVTTYREDPALPQPRSGRCLPVARAGLGP